MERKKVARARWIDSVTVGINAPLVQLKGQVRDRLSWRKPIYVVTERWQVDGTLSSSNNEGNLEPK